MSQAVWRRPLQPRLAIALTILALVVIAATLLLLYRDPPRAKRLNDMPLAERKAYFESLRDTRAVRR